MGYYKLKKGTCWSIFGKFASLKSCPARLVVSRREILLFVVVCVLQLSTVWLLSGIMDWLSVFCVRSGFCCCFFVNFLWF